MALRKEHVIITKKIILIKCRSLYESCIGRGTREVFPTRFYTGPYSLIRIQPLTLAEYLYGLSHAMEREFAASDINSTLCSLSDLLNAHLLSVK